MACFGVGRVCSDPGLVISKGYCSIANLVAAVAYLKENPTADVNTLSEDGVTYLQYACKLGQLEIVRFLLNRGARDDIGSAQFGLPLYITVYSAACLRRSDRESVEGIQKIEDYFQILLELLNYDASQTNMKALGHKCLKVMCKASFYNVGTVRFIRLLLENGADACEPTNFNHSIISSFFFDPHDSHSIFDVAESEDKDRMREAIRLLLKYGAHFNRGQYCFAGERGLNPDLMLEQTNTDGSTYSVNKAFFHLRQKLEIVNIQNKHWEEYSKLKKEVVAPTRKAKNALLFKNIIDPEGGMLAPGGTERSRALAAIVLLTAQMSRKRDGVYNSENPAPECVSRNSRDVLGFVGGERVARVDTASAAVTSCSMS